MTDKIDVLTSPSDLSPSNYVQVLQAHKLLNAEIDDMSNKIDVVIQKSQSQFLVAYQNHIRKIKRELQQMKKKADAHEKELTNNQRMGALEKQVIIFREQALKLYDRLQEKTHEAQIYKIKVKQLEKTTSVAQKQVKDYLKQKKVNQSKLAEAQQRIRMLEESLRNLQSQKLHKHTTVIESKVKSRITGNLHPNSFQDLVGKANRTMPIGVGIRRRSVNETMATTVNLSPNNPLVDNKNDGQLKNWFLECVKSIKRDIAQRKSSGEQINIQYVKNIDQFKMVDKLKLLQKFIENQKILIWMYEKIFPNRYDEVKQYLTKVTPSRNNNTQSEHLIPSNDNLAEITYDKMEITLPKMSETGHKNSQIRNKISMKNGRLNLTMF